MSHDRKRKKENTHTHTPQCSLAAHNLGDSIFGDKRKGHQKHQEPKGQHVCLILNMANTRCNPNVVQCMFEGHYTRPRKKHNYMAQSVWWMLGMSNTKLMHAVQHMCEGQCTRQKKKKKKKKVGVGGGGGEEERITIWPMARLIIIHCIA